MKRSQLSAKHTSVHLVCLVALSCVIGASFFLINCSRATSLPVPDEVIKAALVKESSEKYLDYAQRLLDSSRSVRLIGYEVGPSVPYDPEHNYDHLYKLSDVSRGGIVRLLPVIWNFALTL
jgi:hypothetical protein